MKWCKWGFSGKKTDNGLPKDHPSNPVDFNNLLLMHRLSIAGYGEHNQKQMSKSFLSDYIEKKRQEERELALKTLTPKH